MENGFIESFNGRLRDECLNVSWFTTLTEAQKQLAGWQDHYNQRRPHSALNDQTPADFAAAFDARFALSISSTAIVPLCQGFTSSAHAALDKAVRSPKTNHYEGEALLRSARQTREAVLSLWSTRNARFTGTGGH